MFPLVMVANVLPPLNTAWPPMMFATSEFFEVVMPSYRE